MTPLPFQFEQFLSGGVLTCARVTGLFLVAPFFGGAAIPVRIKAGLALALTVLLGSTPLRPVAPPPSPVHWAVMALGEVGAGVLLGFAFQFVLDGVQFAGQMIGFQMGFSLVNLIDPQTQVDTPVLSIFHQLIGVLIFLEMNVHHWVLRALARSFVYLPAGAALITRPACLSLWQCAGGILLLGAQMAAPVLLATLVVDLALGFVGKASPQLPVLMIGLSLKSLVGLGVAIALLVAWPRILEKSFAGALVAGERMLHLAM